jgi:hypothetical protein
MTRTNPKWIRIYANGYDIGGAVNKIGTVGMTMDAPKGAALTDNILNTVLGQSSIQCGPLNAFLQAGATDIHERMKTGAGTYDILIPFGILGEPAVGNPIFAAKMENGEYTADGSEGIVGVNISFPGASYACPKGYESPFGLLVHAKSAETAANTAIGTIDNGAASAKGGIFVYQLFSSDGTVTLSIDDSATNLNNAAFAALSGATSGSIDASLAPKSGMIALAPTAAVRQYLRWQLALGTANTATFALAFIRGT